MRLNQGSAIFIALLVVVAIIALIFLNDEGDNPNSPLPTEQATVSTVQLFPSVTAATIQQITVDQQIEVDDIRPTPLAGSPTLVPPTALPEGASLPTVSNAITLVRDTAGMWLISDSTNMAVTDTLDSTLLDQNLGMLVNLRSNQQFIPENGDYAQFGLDVPHYDIQFTASTVAATDSGVASPTDTATDVTNAVYRLRLGNQTVGENAYYALLNDDNETIYVVNNAQSLQNTVLNLATNPPIQLPPTPTLAPVLNVPGAPFVGFTVTDATGFTFIHHADGQVIDIVRNAADATWSYTQDGTAIEINEPQLQVILNSFANIQGLQRTANPDLAQLGLDNPAYTLIARTNSGESVLKLGAQDPTNTFYYSLVDEFQDVVLIDASSVQALISLFDNPPRLVVAEATADMTAEPMTEATAEMTPDMTAEPVAEATAEMTPDMTAEPVAEATAEMTPDMTAEPMAETTAEMTPDMTAEPVAEATAEMTPDMAMLPMLEIRYNEDYIALINVSDEAIDLSEFSMEGRDFGDRLEAGACAFLRTETVGNAIPDVLECEAERAYLPISSRATFWATPFETFDVSYQGAVIATCEVADDEAAHTCDLMVVNG